MKGIFRRFAQLSSTAAGSPSAFLLAFLIVLLWGVARPILQFSDTWQLVMNTISPVITFLMVFLIQCAQNREPKAIQLKLNELLRGVAGARTGLLYQRHLLRRQNLNSPVMF
jgi:low affinity Fe/Cu permease